MLCLKLSGGYNKKVLQILKWIRKLLNSSNGGNHNKKEVLQIQGMGPKHCAMILKRALKPFEAKVGADLPV